MSAPTVTRCRACGDAVPPERASTGTLSCSRRCTRRVAYKQPFHMFAAAVERVVPVDSTPAKQAAARELIAAGRLCAYERVDGLIGEIGVPRRREDGGRTWTRRRAGEVDGATSRDQEARA